MKREELRKVEYKQAYLTEGSSIPRIDEGVGFFHQWEKQSKLILDEGNGEAESYIVALVETEEGAMKVINYRNIKFVD